MEDSCVQSFSNSWIKLDGTVKRTNLKILSYSTVYTVSILIFVLSSQPKV